MACSNEVDAHGPLWATPRVATAVPPPPPVPLAPQTRMHPRRFAPWRELAGIAVCAIAFVVIAYMWIGAADPRLP